MDEGYTLCGHCGSLVPRSWIGHPEKANEYRKELKKKHNIRRV